MAASKPTIYLSISQIACKYSKRVKVTAAIKKLMDWLGAWEVRDLQATRAAQKNACMVRYRKLPCDALSEGS